MSVCTSGIMKLFCHSNFNQSFTRYSDCRRFICPLISYIGVCPYLMLSLDRSCFYGLTWCHGLYLSWIPIWNSTALLKMDLLHLCHNQRYLFHHLTFLTFLHHHLLSIKEKILYTFRGNFFFLEKTFWQKINFVYDHDKAHSQAGDKE